MNREQKNPVARRTMYDFPWFRIPAFWEDFENWPTATQTSEASGLTVYEEGDNLIVEAELPGLKRDQIDVSYSKGIVDIRAEQQEEEKSDEKKYYRKSSRSFRYRVSLPAQVDEAKEPTANYQNGVLTLRFNKAQKGSVRKINVQG